MRLEMPWESKGADTAEGAAVTAAPTVETWTVLGAVECRVLVIGVEEEVVMMMGFERESCRSELLKLPQSPGAKVFMQNASMCSFVIPIHI